MCCVTGMSTAASKRTKSGASCSTQASDKAADQSKVQLSWDAYVANQLSSGKDAARQAQLVSTLEAQLARPGTDNGCLCCYNVVCVCAVSCRALLCCALGVRTLHVDFTLMLD